ncbi:MAG: response regulator [Candidatus Paceibacterota bacterium]
MTQERKTLLGKKALILGTDLGFLNTVEKTLSFAGVEVVASKTVKDGIEDIKSLKPDFVIVECTVNNDKELVTDLNNLTANRIPVILVIANTSNDKIDLNYKYSTNKENLNFSDLLEIAEKSILENNNPKKSESYIDITESKKLPIKEKNNIEMRILIFEDDPLLRDMLSIKLTKSKIPFKFCHNGLDAFQILREYTPTLILLDIMLPGKNGLDVLKEIRDDETFSKLPVIVFSNKDTPRDREIASKLKADDFLIKATTNLNDLVALILSKHDCPLAKK